MNFNVSLAIVKIKFLAEVKTGCRVLLFVIYYSNWPAVCLCKTQRRQHVCREDNKWRKKVLSFLVYRHLSAVVKISWIFAYFFWDIYIFQFWFVLLAMCHPPTNPSNPTPPLVTNLEDIIMTTAVLTYWCVLFVYFLFFFLSRFLSPFSCCLFSLGHLNDIDNKHRH